jgi:hypothetical protein
MGELNNTKRRLVGAFTLVPDGVCNPVRNVCLLVDYDSTTSTDNTGSKISAMAQPLHISK